MRDITFALLLSLLGCQKTTLVAAGEVLDEKVFPAEGFAVPSSNPPKKEVVDTIDKYVLAIKVDPGSIANPKLRQYCSVYHLQVNPTPSTPVEVVQNAVDKGAYAVFVYLKPDGYFQLPEFNYPDCSGVISADKIFVVDTPMQRALMEEKLSQAGWKEYEDKMARERIRAREEAREVHQDYEFVY